MLTAFAVTALAFSPGLLEDAPKAERHASLLIERTEIERTRPKILFPILLTTGGVAIAAVGLAFVWAGLFTAIYYAFTFATGSVVLLTIGVVLFAAGVPVTVIGAVKLHRARKERRKADQQLERLDHEEAALLTVATF